MLLDLLRIRKNFGYQAIPDVRRAAVPAPYRGAPAICAEKCRPGCALCFSVCPTGALSGCPPKIDLGLCVFCGDCRRVCPGGAIDFTQNYKMSSVSREGLVVAPGGGVPRAAAAPDLAKIFGRSLKLRQVSAGGCNGCELELNASGNVNFDVGRFGVDFVASPRQADGIVITGPVTRHMAHALEETYLSVPDPKIVIAVGACALSGGVFRNSPELDRSFFGKVKIDLFVPGCPPHPLVFVNAVLDFLGAK